MSVTSITTKPTARKAVAVNFLTTENDPHPMRLIYALAGVTEALDSLTTEVNGNRQHANMIANLSIAAQELAHMLATRLD